jgi:hypothetical protein
VVVPDPVIDGRRVDSLVQELRRYAPHYTPELTLSDEQSAGPALFRIFAQIAEAVLVRLARTPQKHFVAFLDRLGITLLPASQASAPITFKLASGSTDAVTVPAGTRVTATGKDDDIPFETTGELIAIPATLTAAYGVDPAQDAIYPPPPGFLAQEIHTPTELTYLVQAFTAKGAKRMQFDHTTELQPQSFIRINCRDKAVVTKVDENIVTLEQPLERDVPAQSVVTPIRDFEVFNGISRQEHVLYLGDSDVFALKQEAYITLAFTLFDTPGATLSPLNLAWEFWTKDELGPPDSEEHWEPLEIERDGTSALSQSGSVTLVKPVDLEIKEREVGGVKSRWIRARAIDPLPPGGQALPEIDTLTVSVQSTPPGPGAGPDKSITADQGFYNATPLDLKVQPSVGFLPFGTEPRQFDQFYIASKEAFSKRKAEVTLDFALDLQTLAAPSVVQLTTGLRVYSVGLRRRLYELDIASQNSSTLGSPGDLPAGSGFQPLEDSMPSAITESDQIYVFVNTEDTTATDPTKKASKVWVHFHRADGSGANWIDLDAPPTGTDVKQVTFSPAAVLVSGGSPFARVFVVGADGKLYWKDITNAPGSIGGWATQPLPSGESWLVGSSPFVTTSGSDVIAFVTGDDKVVHALRMTAAAPSWSSLTPTDSTIQAISRPFAQMSGTSGKVFVTADQGGNRKLFECAANLLVSGPVVWNDRGAPAAGLPITTDADACAPSGFVETPAAADQTKEGKHIFLRGADNRLYERLDETATQAGHEWTAQTRNGDPDLRDAPFAVAATAGAVTTLSVVSASSRNSIVTWSFEIRHGNVPASPLLHAVLLDAKASPEDGHFVGDTLDLDDGTNTDSLNIAAYEGQRRLARLDPPVMTVDFTKTIDCAVGTEDVGPAKPDSEDLVLLHAPLTTTGSSRPVSLVIASTAVSAGLYSRLTGVVSLPAADQPAGGEAFTLYAEVVPARTEFLSVADTTTVPELSWEYWNGSGWLSLAVNDGTRNLLTSGKVIFTVPTTIQSTEVAGQENFWIRARLVGGDYGRETFRLDGTKIVSEKSTLRPPKVSSLGIIYKGPPVPPGICLTFNNLDYLDQTAACQLGGAHFRPFDRLEVFPDRSFSFFLGFDKPFKSGPVRLLIDAAEREFDEAAPPEFDWQFRKDRRWKKLDVDDGSVALTRPGIVTLSASDELTRETRFGQSLHWIRGSLRTDRSFGTIPYPQPLLRAMLLNTVEAMQGETISGEIVGSSDGEPNQQLPLQHANVLEGEELRIQEALSAEEQDALERLDKNAVVVRDDLEGKWVRWQPTQALFDAGPEDRVYLIDRASGLIQFGDSVHGRIPPAGVDNIRAFTYRTGGGAEGNVAAGKIDSLTTAVAGVESVFNPTDAGGGSDAATTDAMLTIGPRRISHRDRAVSAEDFENLAREASRQVAKARCLTTTNLARRGTGKADPCDPAQRHEALAAPGWVSLIVVPASADPRPCPSLELRRTVKDYLRRRAPSMLFSGDRIVIRPPDYVAVGVEADIFVTSLEQAATAEKKAREALDRFLHPLFGGTDGTGWEFGRPIWKSDVFSTLERIDEVDRVENLRFRFRGTTDPDRVVIGPNELLASDQHVLAIKKA